MGTALLGPQDSRWRAGLGVLAPIPWCFGISQRPESTGVFWTEWQGGVQEGEMEKQRWQRSGQMDGSSDCE